MFMQILVCYMQLDKMLCACFHMFSLTGMLSHVLEVVKCMFGLNLPLVRNTKMSLYIYCHELAPLYVKLFALLCSSRYTKEN